MSTGSRTCTGRAATVWPEEAVVSGARRPRPALERAPPSRCRTPATLPHPGRGVAPWPRCRTPAVASRTLGCCRTCWAGCVGRVRCVTAWGVCVGAAAASHPGPGCRTPATLPHPGRGVAPWPRCRTPAVASRVLGCCRTCWAGCVGRVRCV